MKNSCVAFYFLLLNSCFSYAQMQPADSLKGEYTGQYYFKQPTTNPWTITQDTVYVTNIDSVNCAVQAHDVSNFSLIPPSPPDTNYYTDYFSCNGITPSNHYVKFYDGDSIRIITDNVPQSPPNPSYSMRFYGKRISDKTVGKHELLSSEQVKIFPNPASDMLSIELERKINGEAQLIDLMGREIRSERLTAPKTQIDVRDLKEGIYFLQIKTDKGTTTKKVVVQH